MPKRRHKADHALRHGQRLAVGGAVGPGHGDLLAPEILHAAEGVDQVQHVCHALGRVVDIALQIDQGGPLLQHPFQEALFYGLGHFQHIGMSLADIHVITDADHVGHERDHVGSLAHCLAVGDLRLAFIQVLRLQTQ